MATLTTGQTLFHSRVRLTNMGDAPVTVEYIGNEISISKYNPSVYFAALVRHGDKEYCVTEKPTRRELVDGIIDYYSDDIAPLPDINVIERWEDGECVELPAEQVEEIVEQIKDGLEALKTERSDREEHGTWWGL